MADELMTAPVTQAAGVDSLHPFDAIPDGLQLGMKLAQTQQDMDVKKQQLQMSKEQHQQQSVEKYMDVLTKMGKVKNPKVRQGLFETANNMASLIPGSNPVSPSLLTALQDDTFNERFNRMMQYWNTNRDAVFNDPEMLQTYKEAIEDPDLAKIFDSADKFEAIRGAKYRADVTAASVANTNETRQAVANIMATSHEKTAAIAKAYPTKPDGTPDYEAGVEWSRKQMELAQGKSQAQIDKDKALGGAATTNATVGAVSKGVNLDAPLGPQADAVARRQQQKADAATTSAKAAMIRALAIKDTAGQRIGLQRDRLDNTAVNQIQRLAQPIKQQLVLAQKDIQLLQGDLKDITTRNMSEAVRGMNRLITNVGAMAESGNISLDYKTKYQEVQDLVSRWFNAGPKGRANPEFVSQTRDSILRIYNSTIDGYHSAVRDSIESRRGTVFNDQRAEGLYKIFGVPKSTGVVERLGEDAWNKPKGSTALSPSSALPAPANPAPGAPKGQATPAFIQGLKKIPGLDIKNYLIKKGYTFSDKDLQ